LFRSRDCFVVRCKDVVVITVVEVKEFVNDNTTVSLHQ
jgi:hypothetical protein